MKLRSMFGRLTAVLFLTVGGALITPVFAQDGYHVGEGGDATAPQQPNDQASPNSEVPMNSEDAGPVRMARFSYVDGNVTWRPDGDTDWTAATVNTPMRQGAQIWVGDGGRAEVQFDDGSILRFGSGAVATLQTLYSDPQGEFTEIKMTDGLGSLDLRTDHSIYQIDTPHGAIKSVGPSRVRVGVDDDVEVGVREGTASIDAPQGKVTLHAGDYTDIKDDSTTYDVKPLPEEDSWDHFTDDRHDLMTRVDQNLPQNMQYMGGDLNNYGSWNNDSDYGQVWMPNEGPDWQPYYNGHWIWCDPFGWTWVGAEPWGWLPYHYGTWVHRPRGWCWVPGPVYQCWSPGVVSFTYVGGDICWVPLAPWECVYPHTFGVGYFGPSWGLWFSIGFCGVWGPHGDHDCFIHPWLNEWVNHWHGWENGAHGWEAQNHGVGQQQWANAHFTPANAKFGATLASSTAFGGTGRYRTLSGERATSLISAGHTLGAPARGEPVSGPTRVAQPGRYSWSPNRIGASKPEEATGIVGRPTYRSLGSEGLSRTTQPSLFGERYSSAAAAANAARQSLGWSRTGSYGGFGGGPGNRINGGSFGGTRTYRGSQPGFGGSQRQYGGFQGQRGGSWSVPDHGGWTHVHSGSQSFGGGGSSAGNRGGGGGGSQGGNGRGNGH